MGEFSKNALMMAITAIEARIQVLERHIKDSESELKKSALRAVIRDYIQTRDEFHRELHSRRQKDG